ncbi:MEKHLA domain-containing protein [Pelagophyceae sp. CCMP2097]|nr:MEKHLA domain-containing protein [Pelagophyceae sp. CCMP2097]
MGSLGAAALLVALAGLPGGDGLLPSGQRWRRRAPPAAQFGGRQGCCFKSASYLGALAEPAQDGAARPAAPAEANLWHRDWIWLLDDSLRKTAGQALLPAPRASAGHCASLAANRDIVLVSHEFATMLDGSPVFNYATAAALDLWETPWENFVQLPSTKSADAEEREQRQTLLETVQRDGCIQDYSGVRISTTGRRFRIDGAVVWNVRDPETDALVGQAALFRKASIVYL